MYDVITVGSGTIDVFLYTDSSESISIKTKDSEEGYISYPVGAKLLVNNLDFFTGGGGTNSAASLSRLGLKVAYIGKVGNDENGLRILNELKDKNIDFLGSISQDPEEKTGYSVVLDSLEKRRTILIYKGANNSLDFSEIDLERLKTKWFYFSSMLDKSFKTLEKLSNFAFRNKIKICFNPSNYLCEKGKQYTKNILKNTQILILNKEEASLLAGEGEPLEKIRSLKKLGPEIAIITDGENPVYGADDSGIYFKIFPQDIKVVEATGAGDSFSSSFLAGMIKTSDMESSLKLALVNSHSVLQFKGSKRKLLNYDEALKEINRNDIKIEKGNLV
ncbi:MAG: carbohydrate kinase family protein [Actinobacteria bacterium]|nr:carbohydrate kinase family protein [Actinomycetota bacterium]